MKESKPNIFSFVKQSVTPRRAASFYGLRSDAHGMCHCPFHDDHTPSLKLYDDHYYCFGCGASGDVIDLAGRLLDLSPLDAARRLCRDFGIHADTNEHHGFPPAVPASIPAATNKNELYYRPRDRPIHDFGLSKAPVFGTEATPGIGVTESSGIGMTEAARLLLDLRLITEEIMQKYRLSSPESEWNDVFAFAIEWHARSEILLDQLLFSDKEKQPDVLKDLQKELVIIKDFVCRYDRRKELLND